MKTKKITTCLVFVVGLLSGCTTFLNSSPTSITPDKFKDNGFIVGKISLHDSRKQMELGGLFGTNFTAYVHKVGSKKPYQVAVTNRDQGYFVWRVEPANYFIHYCKLKNSAEEISLRDLATSVVVEAGDIVYIGDIHYEIGDTHLWKTLRHNISDSPNLNMGLLIDIEQQVSDKGEEMKVFLSKTSLPWNMDQFRTQLAESWKNKI